MFNANKNKEIEKFNRLFETQTITHARNINNQITIRLTKLVYPIKAAFYNKRTTIRCCQCKQRITTNLDIEVGVIARRID